MKVPFAVAIPLWVLAAPAAAADSAAPGASQVVVTATRMPLEVDRVPADISVVSGPELVEHGANTLAAALALVPGVEAPAGGDAGPSGAVPSFWGLHEFDAFLLVVDGVPWGGAFNPMITTLDFNDIERVEVLKGSAPVMFGATSFVGVVQELHYPAGQAASLAELSVGSYGSAKGQASFVLPQIGNLKSSLAVDGQSLGFADARETVADGKLLYRGALATGQGVFTIDTDLTFVRDTPPSPVIRVGAGLTPLTPINANFNPANARIDQNEYHLALGYERITRFGQWNTLVSYTRSDIRDVRAFLHPDLSGQADSQDQTRHIDDAYADTHLTTRFGDRLTLVTGADLLFGRGRQITLNGNAGYTVPLNGSVVPPPTTQIAINEIGTVDDRRVFAGEYAQLLWQPDERWDVTAGLRVNETYEHKRSSDFTTPPPALDSQSASRTVVRLTATVGASYRLWRDGADSLVAYADGRSAFKPSALDFGPDYTPDILLPETAKSYEAGLKATANGGRIMLQAALFQLDFRNLVVPTASGALANAAGERLRGVELESRWQVVPDFALAANVAYHHANYTRYLFVDPDSGVGVDVAGNQLPLSPAVLASAGLLYTPPHGLSCTAVLNYVGRRYLDEENTAPVGGYATIAATLGYSFAKYKIDLKVENLTNRRPPVTASEFGSESFYLLNARTVWAQLRYRL